MELVEKFLREKAPANPGTKENAKCFLLVFMVMKCPNQFPQFKSLRKAMVIRQPFILTFLAFFSLWLPEMAWGQSSSPKGAAQFKGHRYEVEARRTKLTWKDAQEVAQSRGGHLVCIESPEEFTFLRDLLKPHPTWSFWVGGYRSEDKWHWLTGKPVSSSLEIKGSGDYSLSMGKAKGGRDFYSELVDRKIGGFIIEYSPSGEVSITMPPEPGADHTEPSSQNEEPAMGNGLVSGNAHAKDLPLKRAQASVNGLLVMPLGGNEHAGAASLMTLSALRGDESEPATIAFNQGVGPTMCKALEEVVKFTELRHDGWPRGRKIEISFENKYNPKDGPSAAVACALLLNSAIEGYDLDSRFAVTGDLNADGSVQPVGGIDAKIRGADNENCTHVAIPAKNSSSVSDSVLLDGYAPIVKIQVFEISNFKQADALARLEREESLQQSFDSFKRISEVYQNKPSAFARSLKHPKMIALLQEILKTTPNHLSANILLQHATDTAPKALSLHGSTAFIENKAWAITDVIDEQGNVNTIDVLSVDQVAEAISLLRRNRDRLDERTWKWANELIEFGTLLNQFRTNPPNAVTNHNKLVEEINAAGRSVRAERRQLFSSPEVMEELLQ